MNIVFDKLICLFYNIVELKETPEYIMVTPFYKNPKVNDIYTEFELDEYELYIVCTQNVTDEKKNSFIRECTSQCSNSPENQFFLCEKDDTGYFADCLNKYLTYIEKAIPEIYKKIESVLDCKELYPFGYIGFEILCE